jgi:ABC-type amino acid transport substrate-binding protein
VQDWIGELSKTDPVVVFCVYGFHVGCRTAGALREAGFDAKFMKGGHVAWKAMGGTKISPRAFPLGGTLDAPDSRLARGHATRAINHLGGFMKSTMLKLSITAAATAAALAAAPAMAGKTVDAVKARGSLVCGVNTGLAGFSQADSQGAWTGIDVDVCKAIAAALLNDASKVKYVPLTAQQRFTALQSGEIDILSRNTTYTLTRDASLGLHFLPTTYYDGQGFMVPVKSKVKSAKSLKGATVCVQSGTTTEKNLTDYSRANKLDLKPIVFEKQEAATGAYFSGRCVAFTTEPRASPRSATRTRRIRRSTSSCRS